MKTPLLSLAFAVILVTPVLAFAAGKGQPTTIPDFTKGAKIPAGAKHDWNLGPTGLRGWMFCDKMVTSVSPDFPRKPVSCRPISPEAELVPLAALAPDAPTD